MKYGLCSLMMFSLFSGVLYGQSQEQKQETQKHYYAVYLGQAKLGYMRCTRTVKDDKVTTTSKIKFSIRREQFNIIIIISTKEVETIDGKPVSFRTVQEMSGSRQVVTGEILPDGMLKVTTESAGQKKTKTIPWPEGALMSEGLQRVIKEKGLKPGTKYDALVFDAQNCTSTITTITIGEKEKIDVMGRVRDLYRMTQSFVVNNSPMNMVTYVNDNFELLKMTMGMMGMQLEIIACDRTFAISPCNSDIDFLKNLSITSPAEIPNNANDVKYIIEPLDGKELLFPQIAGQTVKKTSDGLYEITVKTPKMPKDVKFPYTGKNADALKALNPSEYVQSDAPEIQKLAKQAIGDAKDAATAAKRIQTFVRKYIHKKDLSVGFASALDVARSKAGDCTEHAVLAAALCRAVGIPARLAMGIVYVDGWMNYKHVFLGHAWVLVYVGDKWAPIDAAVPVCPAGHIILATSDDNEGMSQFFSLVNLMGYFKIKQAIVEKK